MTTDAHVVMAKGSKSFALAAKLLPPSRRDAIAVLYAYCRHVDDAIDLAPKEERPAALAKLRTDLDRIYGGEGELAPVVTTYHIPREYFDALIDGMEMDVNRTTYKTLEDLRLYCYRVAGVVGLMLCHVMGVSNRSALANARDLGIGMQLTNICRDVAEDAADGRNYLPPGYDVRALLEEADRYYESGDRGMIALSFRCSLAVRAARLIYSAIGTELRRRNCDPYRGRVVVPLYKKLYFVVVALILTLLSLKERARSRHDVVPI